MFTKAEHKAHHTHQTHQKSQIQPSFAQSIHQEQFIGTKNTDTFVSPSLGNKSFIQPKLSISQPGDPYEKEADATAEKVMRMPEGSVQLSTNKEEEIQRKEDSTEPVSEQSVDTPVVQLKTETLELQTKEEEDKEEEATTQEGTIQLKQEEDKEEEDKAHSSATIIQPSSSTYTQVQRFTNIIGHTSTNRGIIAPSRPRYNTIQRMGRAPPMPNRSFEQSLQSTKGGGSSLDPQTGSFMESRFGADFSGVRVHTGSSAIQLSTSIGAQAFTHGNDVYFNAGKYRPDTDTGRHLLAHELTHTIQQSASPSIKPFLKTSDRGLHRSAQTVEDHQDASSSEEDTVQPLLIQKTDESIRPELHRAVAFAKSQIGSVNAKMKDAEGKRVGWQRLIDYFRTAMGEDKITATGAPYKTGDVNEDQIIHYNLTKDKVLVPNPDGGTKMDRRDAMPSWCGIFVFWALNKGGVPMNKWKLGMSSVDLKSAYPPKYVPKKGDIAYKGPPYMHYAIVDKSEPENETNPNNAKVTTINGNTAGSDNLGGQVASSTDPIGAWTKQGGFFNPLFGKESQLPANPKEFSKEELNQILSAAGAPTVSTSSSETSTKGGVKPYTPEKRSGTTSPETGMDEAAKTKDAPEATKDEAESEVKEDKPMPMAPKSPAEDPAFGEVIKGVAVANKKQKVHGDPQEKADAAQAASQIDPELDVNSQAQGNQVGKMSVQEASPFNAKAFKDQLMERIVAALPKNDEETLERYDDKSKQTRAMEEAKEGAKGDVKKEKENAGKTIADTSNEKPSTEGVKPKIGGDLVPEDAGKKPFVPKPETAAPKPKTDEEISMEKDAQELDSKMAESNVTDEQLAKSNEPKFTGALDEKNVAQQEARNAPAEYREKENPQLNKAAQQSKQTVYGKLGEMYDARTDKFGKVDASKTDTKNKDEAKRKEVAEGLQKIYTKTKEKVDKNLADLETAVTNDFDTAATAANAVFERNVNKRLDDHYGWTTVDDTIGDWARGHLSPEIDRIFQEEKKTFVDAMDVAITAISQKVADGLNATMKTIADGKVEIETYWKGLDEEGRKLGATAKEDILGKFTELEQSVQEKNDQLVDKLQAKYVENVQKLQETFDKIKESKQGWLSGALNAIAAVIRTILELKDMLFDTLARVAHVIGDIISDPIGFLSNMIDAVMMGMNLFIEHLPEHLKKGLIEWIMGNMPPGIVLPAVWDLKGIFGFVMQILGLTWANIRQRAVLKLGEPTVAALETVFEIFQIIMKEGITGLWKYIMDQVGNLQVLIMDAIKNFLIEKIIMAGIEWIIGLLNPAAAFIKACKLIYNLVMFFVENGKRILALVNAVIDSAENIVKGDIVGAAKWIEAALAKLIPITIGFLASLLGLSGITEKVQKIIKAIQAPINKAIDWVIDKAIALAKKLGIDKIAKKVNGKVEDTKKWAKDKVEKGKEWVGDKVDAVKNWAKRILGIQKSFQAEDGSSHRLYFKKAGNDYELMINPAPAGPFEKWVNKIDAGSNAKKVAKKAQAISKSQEIDKEKAKKITDTYTEDKKAEKLRELMDELSAITGALFAGERPSCAKEGSGLDFGSLYSGKYGKSMKAEFLTNKDMPSGSVPSVSHHKSFAIINQRRNGAGSYYILGHLLNHNLGGTGKDWKNLTPLTRDANSAHEHIAEARVKNAVSAGNIVYYKVEAQYGRGAASASNKTIQEIMTEEAHVPLKLVCEAEMVTPADVSNDGKESRTNLVPKGTVIENTVDQNAKNYDLTGIKRETVYLDSRSVETISSIDEVNKPLAEKIVDAWKDKLKNEKTRFSSFDALAEYIFTDGRKFTALQKTTILSLPDLGYVKLFQS